MLNGVYNIVVAADNCNLNYHVYREIYGGPTGCIITVNGVTFPVVPSTTIQIKINTVNGGCGCYLMGVKKDFITVDPDLGSISVSDEPPIDTNYVIFRVGKYVIHSGGFKILYNKIVKLFSRK